MHAYRDRPRGPRARPRGRHRPADLLDGGAATRPRCRGSDTLDINASERAPRQPYKHRGDAARLETSPGEALADRIEVPTAWMNERSDKKRWEGFAPLEPAERRAILAKAVAMTLKPRLAYSTVKNREFEATVARLKPDFAARIRPRADQLWKRVPKERTLKVAAAVFGEEWAEWHAKLKRPALAEAVEAAFAGTDPSVDEEGGSVAPSGRGRVRGLRHAASRRRARRAWRAQGGPVARTPRRRRRPWRRRRRQRPPTSGMESR